MSFIFKKLGGSDLSISYNDTRVNSAHIQISDSPKIFKPPATLKSDHTATFETTGILYDFAATGAQIGAKLYMFGGTFDGSYPSYPYVSDAIRIYDFETFSWTTSVTAMPYVYSGLSAAAVGTKIYVFGNGDEDWYDDNGVHVFDTETETFTALSASLPSASTKWYGCIAPAVVDNDIYLFGGYSGARANGRNEESTNRILKFNIDTGTITSAGTLPKAMHYIKTAVVGTKVYLFGGYYRKLIYPSDGSNTSPEYFTSILVYDTETRSIDTIAESFPITLNSNRGTTVVVGDCIYWFHGGGDIIKVDTTTNTTVHFANILPYSPYTTVAYPATVGSDKINIFRYNVGMHMVFDASSDTVSTINSWQTWCSFDDGGVSCASANGKTYLFYGRGIEVFDPEIGLVTKSYSRFPSYCRYCEAATVGSTIYLFGGHDGSQCLDTINVFDTETETITTLSATLPVAARYLSSAVVGTKIYLFGGHDDSQYLDTINVFDTETEMITTLSTTLPIDSYRMSSVVFGTKIYLFGGYGGSQYLNTINVFDTETETITTLSTTLPSAATNIKAAVVGHSVCLFGGYKGSTSVAMFDPDTEQIISLSDKGPSSSTISASVCSVIGTKIYVFAGSGAMFDTDPVVRGCSVMKLGSNNSPVMLNIDSSLISANLGIESVCVVDKDGDVSVPRMYTYEDDKWTDINTITT